jgi:hypothetical protein
MWMYFFIVSFCVNLLSLFYVRWLLSTIEAINEDITNLSEMVSDFSRHTKEVYELEMFYGDETLKSLMEHSTKLSDRLEGMDLILNEEEDPIAEDET